MSSKDLLVILMSRICPAFLWRNIHAYPDFSAFTFRPTYLLATVRAPVSLFMIPKRCYLQIALHHQHRSAADIFNLISVPPCILGSF
jgi:hypothetical protein